MSVLLHLENKISAILLQNLRDAQTNVATTQKGTHSCFYLKYFVMKSMLSKIWNTF